MFRANAEFALPPGDRDDVAPEMVPASAPIESHLQERTPELPTLLVVRKVLEGRQLAFAEIELALKRNDWPVADAAGMRLREACMHDMQILSARLHKEIQEHRRGVRERQAEEA